MDGAAHLTGLLDVRDLAAAKSDPRRDPRRPTEGVVAHVDHGEPVDLTDRLAVDFEADRARVVQFLEPLLGEVRAVPALPRCLQDVLAGNLVVTCLPRPVRGLSDEVRYLSELGGELVLVLHHARRLLHQPGDAGRIEVQEALLLHAVHDEARVPTDVLFG